MSRVLDIEMDQDGQATSQSIMGFTQLFRVCPTLGMPAIKLSFPGELLQTLNSSARRFSSLVVEQRAVQSEHIQLFHPCIECGTEACGVPLPVCDAPLCGSIHLSNN